MSTLRRKRQRLDHSHTFHVSLDDFKPTQVSSIAIVDRVPADCRRTLPQLYHIEPPAPVLTPASSMDPFFGALNLDMDDGNEVPQGSSLNSELNFDLDPVAVRKRYASSVRILFHLVTRHSEV
jgi:hypothetical protein